MFDGFHEARIPVGDAEIFALAGGAGPPLLLLHGFPQNHVMWQRTKDWVPAARAVGAAVSVSQGGGDIAARSLAEVGGRGA